MSPSTTGHHYRVGVGWCANTLIRLHQGRSHTQGLFVVVVNRECPGVGGTDSLVVGCRTPPPPPPPPPTHTHHLNCGWIQRIDVIYSFKSDILKQDSSIGETVYSSFQYRNLSCNIIMQRHFNN